jgi:hypothetical protein
MRLKSTPLSVYEIKFYYSENMLSHTHISITAQNHVAPLLFHYLFLFPLLCIHVFVLNCTVYITLINVHFSP